MRSADAPPIEVWDFTVFTGPPTEKYPSATTLTEMHWYQDAQHFRRSLGNLVLNQMFNLPSDGPSFGTQLTPANIEEHLVTQRDARDAYRGNHADHVQLAAEGLNLRR